MQKNLTTWLPVLLLVVLGALAGTGNMLQSGMDSDDGYPAEIAVTSRSDRGPGSLRAALFAAIKAPHSVVIRIAVDAIDIEVPLPPIAADRVTIVGDAENPVLLRRAHANTADSELLQIISNDVSIRHIAIDAAGTPAIVVRGDRARLEAISIVNASVAVECFDCEKLAVRASEFSAHDIGIRLGGRRTTATIIDNEFRDSRQSGIWMALTSETLDADFDLRVHDNRFSGGRDAIVAVNVRADVRGNRISRFSHAGIRLMDAHASVIGNQVLDNDGIGIHVSRLHRSAVVENEVARNEQIGILIVDAHGLQVDRNQVYQNGYGIAAVGLNPIDASVRQNMLTGQAIDGLITIGESPYIDGNHSVENGHAGIRIMNLVRHGLTTISAQPQLGNNTISGNGNNDVQFGDYVVNSP